MLAFSPIEQKLTEENQARRMLTPSLGVLAVVCFLALDSPSALAGGHSRPKPAPSPSVSPSPSPSPLMDLKRTDEISATQVKWSRTGKALSQSVGPAINSQISSDAHGIDTQLNGTVLGKSKSLVSTTSETNSTFTTGETSVFAGGLQLVSFAYPLDSGPLSKHYEIAPIQLKLASINFPVGPILVNVEGGLSLEAALDAELIPYMAVPFEDSSLVLHIKPKASSNAFIEGSASVLVVKAGVGGDIAILDADLQAYGTVYANPALHPSYSLNGHVGFLKGEFYGFAKVYNLFQLGWSTIWHATFFSWPGACYQFDGNLESAGKCSQ